MVLYTFVSLAREFNSKEKAVLLSQKKNVHTTRVCKNKFQTVLMFHYKNSEMGVQEKKVTFKNGPLNE